MAQRRDRRHGHQHRGRGPQSPTTNAFGVASTTPAEKPPSAPCRWTTCGRPLPSVNSSRLTLPKSADVNVAFRTTSKKPHDAGTGCCVKEHWCASARWTKWRASPRPLTLPSLDVRGRAPDALLLEAAEATLFGRPRRDWPEAWTLLDGHALTSWGTFDLDEALEAWAKRSSGLRFREREPHFAMLLHRHGRVDLRGLLVERGRERARQGENPFPESWREALVDASATLPEVDGDAEVAKGRSDLRHLPS